MIHYKYYCVILHKVKLVNNLAKKKKIDAVIKNKRVKYSPFLPKLDDDFARNYVTRSKEAKEADKISKEKCNAKRKKIINALTFVFNIALLAGILIWQLSSEKKDKMVAPNWYYIGVLIGLFALLMLIETLKIFILIKRSTKQNRLALSYKVSALGRYYDSITPQTNGGQPFQMLYMNKRGIRGDASTGIPLMKYITWQISYVFICVFVLLYNAFKYGSATDAVTTTVAWIAVSINVVIFSSIILLSVSKRFGPKLVIWILKLLSKMHIVKNYQKTFRKVMRFVVNYQKTFKTLASSPFVLISEMLLAIADIVIGNLMAYFVCRAYLPAATFESLNITIFYVFIKSIICGLTLAFVPTPGASGGAEALFLVIFGNIFEAPFLPLITWRIVTYYIYLVQGLVVLVYDFAIGNRRYEKKKQAETLGVTGGTQRHSFRETLIENRKTIETVKSQEEDKLLKQTFTGMDYYDSYDNYGDDEVIKNSNLVTKEELSEKVYPAEQMLLEMRLKDLNKQKKQKAKKVIKFSNSKKYKRIKRH